MLNVLLTAKTIPVHRLNYDENLFMNHFGFIASILCFISIIFVILTLCCLATYEIDNNYKKFIKHATPLMATAVGTCMLLMLMFFCTQLFPFRVTSHMHIGVSSQMIDTQIQVNLHHIKHEKTNINIYKKDINNSTARYRLRINKHNMNKNIKYDNKHVKYIKGPWIHHKFVVPYGHQIGSWWHHITTKQYYPGR